MWGEELPPGNEQGKHRSHQPGVALSSIVESVQRARDLGIGTEAIGAWRELLQEGSFVDEADYSDWARELADQYIQDRRGLSAARIFEYLIDTKQALQLYQKHGTARDCARVYRLARRLNEASDAYREVGMLAHAAVAAEENNAFATALSVFEQLMRSYEVSQNPYPCGLAALNAGRLAMQCGQQDRATTWLAAATRILEQEADAREQNGDKEGAFRCYLSLIQIGKVGASYENLAEGYLNCIRILKSKADRFFTMQYYYDFIQHSNELGEYHAVAELFREAGEYAKRVGFIYGDYFMADAAEAWLRVGRRGLEQNNPVELVENAFLAAVGCFNRIQNDKGVADCYELLQTLQLPESKLARYAALAKELREESFRSGGGYEGPVGLPDFFRRRIQIPDIWVQDLLETERGSDIPDAIGALVGDHKNVWEVQRRKALLIALEYEDHVRNGGEPDQVPIHMIERLGELGHPAAVRPLNALYDVGDEATRIAVVQRCGALKKKEVFPLVERAIHSPSESLRAAGSAALRRLTFPQAMDSLARLFAIHESAEIREVCLQSIATIGTDEACELLLDVMRANTHSLGTRAQGLLERHAQERMLSALERNRRQEPDPNLRLFIGRLIENVRAKRGTVSTLF